MKVWNYMTIMLVLMIFLTFLGFPPIGSSEILNDVGIVMNSTTGEIVGEDISGSNWQTTLLLILTSGIGSAFVVGYFTKTFDWRLALVGFFTSFVILFVKTGWGIMQLARDTGETWLIAIVATIFLPLTAMFIFSVVEWFGGND